ncbi:unnamed protein product [Boreogadus saida]
MANGRRRSLVELLRVSIHSVLGSTHTHTHVQTHTRSSLQPPERLQKTYFNLFFTPFTRKRGGTTLGYTVSYPRVVVCCVFPRLDFDPSSRAPRQSGTLWPGEGAPIPGAFSERAVAVDLTTWEKEDYAQDRSHLD